MIDNSNIFTVDQLAEYLNMAPVTIYRHAARGTIPGRKVGGSWRFHREAIDAWLRGSLQPDDIKDALARTWPDTTANGRQPHTRAKKNHS